MATKGLQEEEEKVLRKEYEESVKPTVRVLTFERRWTGYQSPKSGKKRTKGETSHHSLLVCTMLEIGRKPISP